MIDWKDFPWVESFIVSASASGIFYLFDSYNVDIASKIGGISPSQIAFLLAAAAIIGYLLELGVRKGDRKYHSIDQEGENKTNKNRETVDRGAVQKSSIHELQMGEIAENIEDLKDEINKLNDDSNTTIESKNSDLEGELSDIKKRSQRYLRRAERAKEMVGLHEEQRTHPKKVRDEVDELLTTDKESNKK